MRSCCGLLVLVTRCLLRLDDTGNKLMLQFAVISQFFRRLVSCGRDSVDEADDERWPNGFRLFRTPSGRGKRTRSLCGGFGFAGRRLERPVPKIAAASNGHFVRAHDRQLSDSLAPRRPPAVVPAVQRRHARHSCLILEQCVATQRGCGNHESL